MKYLVVLIGFLATKSHYGSCATLQGYENERNKILEAEYATLTGNELNFSEKENDVELIFEKYKKAEIARGYDNPAFYAPSLHFFKAKPLIEKSKIFKIIKRMPKGALLHLHNTASVSSDWFIRNITYRYETSVCYTKKGLALFVVLDQWKVCETAKESILSLRKRRGSSVVDKWLDQQINLYTPYPELDYPSIKTVWSHFSEMFNTVGDILTYAPVYKDYHYQMLQELYDDGIMYVELRTSLHDLYDMNGKIYKNNEVVCILKEIVDKFKKANPDFLGLKVIYSTYRRVKPMKMQEKIDTFIKFRDAFPDFVIGFDIVGQEDMGEPLIQFVQQMQTIADQSKFFFHAGETNWFGSSTDLNVIDAILLNTTRIGHGYSIMKHPYVWNAIKKRDIAIEINPISNQVLHLVEDLRNHPATFYLSENIPIVISNDDPGFWNARGLSYDMYYAVMAFAPINAGLKTLKQLVYNSLKYSVLSDEERKNGTELFEVSWNKFINTIN